ncbi:hypothetical protein HGRIS_004499 [Hohenbuehelia grisea]|uniref:F-box domain-containing protein n=1 Tax=Hohenbuehelia grisea TaxID=104357 RepID=A0ABR3JCT6_9AGAR
MEGQLSSPIQKATADVLMLIFDTYCQTPSERSLTLDFPQKPQDILNRKEPFVLSHVCRDWRRIITTMPNLWNEISIAGIVNDRHLFLARLYLERSGTTPLYITVYHEIRRWLLPLGLSTLRCSKTGMLFEILLESRARWRSLRASLNDVPNNLVEAFSVEAFPILQTANIDDCSGEFPPGGDVIARAPQLRRYYLGDFRAIALSNSSLLTQITHLDTGRCRPTSVNDILAALPLLPHLTHLSFHIDSSQGPFPILDSRIPFPSLQSLAIQDISGKALTDILNSMDLPSLRSLRIITYRDRPEFWEQFDQAMSRSPLESLHWTEYLNFRDLGRITDCLRCSSLRGLTDLQLSVSHDAVPSQALALLSTGVLPKLRSFGFSWDSFATFAMGQVAERELVDMVAARVAKSRELAPEDILVGLESECEDGSWLSLVADEFHNKYGVDITREDFYLPKDVSRLSCSGLPTLPVESDCVR